MNKILRCNVAHYKKSQHKQLKIKQLNNETVFPILKQDFYKS